MLAPGQRLKADRYEAMVALRVTHPNVLVPRDTFVDGSLAVLVLELCAGSMADVLAEHDALTAEQAFALLEGPLAAAHAAEVVHRDVKPSNLLVRGDGTVLLANFGIARMLADAWSPA